HLDAHPARVPRGPMRVKHQSREDHAPKSSRKSRPSASGSGARRKHASTATGVADRSSIRKAPTIPPRPGREEYTGRPLPTRPEPKPTAARTPPPTARPRLDAEPERPPA